MNITKSMGKQDMLQKPFNEKEFTKFFKEYKNSRTFKKLYIRMKDKYYNLDLDDIDSIINQAIYYAYKTYSSNSNCKITSWTQSNIRWHLCKFYLATSRARNKHKKNPTTISLDTLIQEDKRLIDLLEDESTKIPEDDIDRVQFITRYIYKSYIPHKEDVINHYINEKTCREISTLYGVTHQAVSQRISWSLSKMRNKFKKKGISYVF